jgi:hypothetical protein
MVSGIRFFAASGAMGGTPAGRATPNIEIFNLEAGATNNPNRMGFFGLAGAPNSAVVVGLYQDRTFRCDETGTDYGQMINVKFTGASSAEVSGVPLTSTGHTLATIPQSSGTLLCRFTEPNSTAVATQNATFRAINLTAGSGAPNIGDLATNITIKAAQLADTQGHAGNASWQNIDSGGSALSLNDQSSTNAVHDFHLIVSGSPAIAGRKINFAYYLQLEFL